MKNKPLVLIMCGGRSLRLWPLSCYKSKNFFDVFGFSPLELTIKRFLKVTDASNIFLVANKKEKKLIGKIKLLNKQNIFYEPKSKNTAAAILLSLWKLKKFSGCNLIISPVDQLIKKESAFYSSLKDALKVAQSGGICTLGIKPDKPVSGFGYIQAGENEYGKVFSVKKFIEKPSVEKARQFIRRGSYFYNSGIFIASVSTLIDEYQKYYSNYHYFVDSIQQNKIADCYLKIEDVPFDKAIIEKSKKVKLIKGSFIWKDFGNWQAIYEILAKDKFKNAKIANGSFYQSRNNLLYLDNKKKKVLMVGVNNLSVVDTEDYMLIAASNCLDSLKLSLKKAKLL